jgi:hypothetical protein
MKAWILAQASGLCGECRGQYEKGARILELRGEHWRKRRCENCGNAYVVAYGEAEDETAPAPLLKVTPVEGFSRVAESAPRIVKLLKFDAKQRQAGEGQ